MANEKNINSRIQHKHDIEANWLKATTFIPKQGELIVYDVDSNYNYERVKVGDGVSNVNALPFITDGEFLKKTGDQMTGPLGFTLDVGYGQIVPVDGFEGQIFFLEDTIEEEEIISLPPFSENDNNKFLKIVNGALTWTTISSAEGVSF